MHFTKMHSNGNDYVYINSLIQQIPHKKRSQLAKKISHRNFGIGSDGLIFIDISQNHSFSMDMYNSDGSQSEMCGNGLLCIAKYIFDHQITPQKSFPIKTSKSSYPAQIFTHPSKKNKAQYVEVNMGYPLAPSDNSKKMSILNHSTPILSSDIHVIDRTFQFVSISMPNPHCIIFLDEPIQHFPLHKYAPPIEKYPLFPNGVNVEFVNVINRSKVFQRTWERGTGETLACGSGACATLVAGVLLNKLNHSITNSLLGGDLLLRWTDQHVFLKGQPITVFDGTFYE